jgi:O-acetyl-ADP-ribose deacetylase (regulator of RNase III)
MIKGYVKKSILLATQKFIVHGVNCQNKMGSGVAKVLFTKYPKVKSEYHHFCNINIPICINGQEDLLGSIQFVDCGKHTVVNAFTQEKFGYDGELYLSYKAIAEIFTKLNSMYDINEIAIPMIGCGLAGGPWEGVKEIINLTTPNTDVYVYHLGELDEK